MRGKRLAREERFQLEKPSNANGAIRAGTLHPSSRNNCFEHLKHFSAILILFNCLEQLFFFRFSLLYPSEHYHHLLSTEHTREHTRHSKSLFLRKTKKAETFSLLYSRQVLFVSLGFVGFILAIVRET